MFYLKNRAIRQIRYIKNYEFHESLGVRVKKIYPHLTDDNIETVFDVLKDYFCFCNQARRKMVGMPSQVVDIAWHEFILFTRQYEQFSKKGLGLFLHHTPNEAMQSPTLAREGMKRVWRLACANEDIDPADPESLPRIFAIDSVLSIEDGFTYSLDKLQVSKQP